MSETKDYSEEDLTGESFAGKDLTGYNFINANLTDVNFAGAIITNADFKGATFERTLMVGTKLEEAKNIPEDYSGIIHHIWVDYLCRKLNNIMPSIQQKLSDAYQEVESERKVEKVEFGGNTPSAGWRLERIEEAQKVLTEILNPLPRNSSLAATK
jgi:uncharacterized protein YjbI with pentapeptide repeats